MDDAGVGRHDLEVAERRLAPAQERVALAVALELDRGCWRRARRAVPYSSTCTEWSMTSSAGASGLTRSAIAAEAHDRLAHRRQVDDARHAGEVLQDDARRREGDLVRGRGLRVPVEQRLDVGARDVDAVLEAQQVLEQDLQRVGQARDLVLRQSRAAPDLVRAVADLERRARLEAVRHAILRGKSARIISGVARHAARACSGARLRRALRWRQRHTAR